MNILRIFVFFVCYLKIKRCYFCNAKNLFTQIDATSFRLMTMSVEMVFDDRQKNILKKCLLTLCFVFTGKLRPLPIYRIEHSNGQTPLCVYSKYAIAISCSMVQKG